MQYSETAIVQPLAHPTSAYLLIYISVNERRGQNSSFSSPDISFPQHNHHILHSVSIPAIHHSRSRLHHWTSSSSHNSHTHHPPALLSPAPIKLPSNPPPHHPPLYYPPRPQITLKPILPPSTPALAIPPPMLSNILEIAPRLDVSTNVSLNPRAENPSLDAEEGMF